MTPIPVVDIFAGPGGLGEGFSALALKGKTDERLFSIAISAEMDTNAVRTLRLRAFFRQFAKGHAPKSYYEYLAGRSASPWSARTRREWGEAEREALRLTLGNREDDERLHARIGAIARSDGPWVLIGGPPCQAYSLVGRNRIQAVAGYLPEEDPRFFLYRHYRSIVGRFSPAVFVMENVEGLLSAKIEGKPMFPRIVSELRRPAGKSGTRYRILPLVRPERPVLADEYSPRDFLVRAEEHGVPQARHRVVLLGVREDVSVPDGIGLIASPERFTVADALSGLPSLRSGITRTPIPNWETTSREILAEAAAAAKGFDEKVSARLSALAQQARRQKDPGTGDQQPPAVALDHNLPKHLADWLCDRRLEVVVNHQAREHMTSDLERYGYAAAFTEVYGRSPRGAREFPEKLHPNHRNWKGGKKFVDRFKVQVPGRPGSTVTSHLAKDGHYFIHPDPLQLRSLTVREAARLQTFPDNYYFEGKPGSQRKQVGNAVPPFLASSIAAIVHRLLG